MFFKSYPTSVKLAMAFLAAFFLSMCALAPELMILVVIIVGVGVSAFRVLHWFIEGE
jgi:hypothetical protein